MHYQGRGFEVGQRVLKQASMSDVSLSSGILLGYSAGPFCVEDPPMHLPQECNKKLVILSLCGQFFNWIESSQLTQAVILFSHLSSGQEVWDSSSEPRI